MLNTWLKKNNRIKLLWLLYCTLYLIYIDSILFIILFNFMGKIKNFMVQHKNVIIIASLALFWVFWAWAILFSSDDMSRQTDSSFVKGSLISSCKGILPAQGVMWDTEESIRLTSNTARTYSRTDTAIKCQYKCNTGFTGAQCISIHPKAEEVVTCIFTGSLDKQECKASYGDRSYSCSWVWICKVNVSWIKWTKLNWESTCWEKTISTTTTTTIDNKKETVSFLCQDLWLYEAFLDGNSVNRIESITKANAVKDCKSITNNNPLSKLVCSWRGQEFFRQESTLPLKVEEEVTCIFTGSTDMQECKALNKNVSYKCSWIWSCKVSVWWEKWTKLSWESTCWEKMISSTKITTIDSQDETVSFLCQDLWLYEIFIDGNSVNKIESITKATALENCKSYTYNYPLSTIICNWKDQVIFRQEAKQVDYCSTTLNGITYKLDPCNIDSIINVLLND